jgi:HTH-type transcriptional regulator, sugar sensing transcriptional regulator
MIERMFEKLGLKPEEAKIYLSLLQSGPETAGNIAKRAGIKRPSAYVYLERLLASGLVMQAVDRGVKHFAAEPAEKLKILYQQKIDELRLCESHLDDVLLKIQMQSGLEHYRPRIKFFEGQEGVQRLLQDCWQYQNIEALTMWPIKSFQEALSEDFLYYHNMMRIKQGITVKAIWENVQTRSMEAPPHLGSGKDYLREVRLAPPDMKFDMGYWIYANKAAFVSSRAENFGFMIESAELIQMLKIQHAAIWNISSPIEILPKGAALFFEEFKKIL